MIFISFVEITIPGSLNLSFPNFISKVLQFHLVLVYAPTVTCTVHSLGTGRYIFYLLLITEKQSTCLTQLVKCSKFKNIKHQGKEVLGSSYIKNNLLYCNKKFNYKKKKERKLFITYSIYYIDLYYIRYPNTILII